MSEGNRQVAASRRRGLDVLAHCVAAGGLFAGLTQTWVRTTATEAIPAVDVSGNHALPWASAVLLVVGAGALWLLFARGILRRVAGVLVALSWCAVCIGVVGVLRAPLDSADDALAAVLGAKGLTQAELGISAATTGWPWVAAGAAAAAALLAVARLVVWSGAGSKARAAEAGAATVGMPGNETTGGVVHQIADGTAPTLAATPTPTGAGAAAVSTAEARDPWREWESGGDPSLDHS